jgi:hypothetical protein
LPSWRGEEVNKVSRPMRITPPEKLEAVMTALKQLPAFARLADVAKAMQPGTNERALQRRLGKLIAQGRVTRINRTCGARYCVSGTSTDALKSGLAKATPLNRTAPGGSPIVATQTAESKSSASTPTGLEPTQARTPAVSAVAAQSTGLRRPPIPAGIDANAVTNVIREIVRRRLSRITGAMFINQSAIGHPSPGVFTAVVHDQLRAFEEYNCDAYGVEPEEFRAFVKTW